MREGRWLPRAGILVSGPCLTLRALACVHQEAFDVYRSSRKIALLLLRAPLIHSLIVGRWPPRDLALAAESLLRC